MFYEKYYKEKYRGCEKIYGFEGEYSFLRNDYPSEVCFDEIAYHNADIAYHAQKLGDREEKLKFSKLGLEEANKLIENMQLPPEWNDTRVEIMYSIIKSKFAMSERLRYLLLATTNSILINANNNSDTFWGVDAQTGEGKNYLGLILMKVRKYLKYSGNYREMLNHDYFPGDYDIFFSYNFTVEKTDCATKDSWVVSDALPQCKLSMNPIALSFKQIETLKWGHFPENTSDLWFMYCDENSINYYRTDTGICCFHAKYRYTENSCTIYEVYAPDDEFSTQRLFEYLIAFDSGDYNDQLNNLELFGYFVNKAEKALNNRDDFDKFSK